MWAWLFPGQGAQHTGMGLDLLAKFARYREIADRILGYSVRDVCAGTLPERLRQTEYVQPTLFVVEAMGYLARSQEHPTPQFLAGHSLGELVALWAAGCLDFETALRLVRTRGELMGQAGGGAMAAVIGLDADAVAAVLARQHADRVDVASHNGPDQAVLSGPREEIDRLATSVRAVGGRYVPLNVSVAFHSRYMRPAAEAFTAAVSAVRFEAPRIPVIANATAQPYPPTGIGDLLVRQVVSPVRWRESMRELALRGVREVAEIGPGSVLSKLWQACAPDRDKLPNRASTPVPAGVAGPAPAAGAREAEQLGSAAFRRDYGVRYAYLAGSMFHGISSTDLVIRMGEAGLLGFFGSGGLALTAVEAAIRKMRDALGDPGRFGMNLLANLDRPADEDATVELYLRHDIRFVEAAAYTTITPALVRFRFSGAFRGRDGRPQAPRRVVAKVSRPATAATFMSSPPANIVDALLRQGRLTAEEAAAARRLPVSQDVCVEADSGGHTDGGVALTLIPGIVRLRDRLAGQFAYPVNIRVGASGGLGTPEAVAAAFLLGAEFVVTGSVNQCTVEAGTSALVKDMLTDLDVHDTTYAPAGDMFELGARAQVMRKGTLFAARASKLYQVYRTCGGLDELDDQVRASLERTCFRGSFDDVWDQVRQHLLVDGRSAELHRAEQHPKLRMALLFRWYFADTTVAAIQGRVVDKVNFQVHCGPAMGAFNRLVAGGRLERWPDRHVDTIAELLMSGAAQRLSGWSSR